MKHVFFKVNSYLLLLFILTLSGFAQKNSVTKIQVQKFPCCDSLRIEAGQVNDTDTLRYEQLLGIYFIKASFKGCNHNTSVNVMSYEIQTDDGKIQSVNGNRFDVKTISFQKIPSYFTIIKCHVKCTNGEGQFKEVVLPDRKFVVTP